MSEELLSMDEAGKMAVTYLATWGNAVKELVVTKVEETRFWKRVTDDEEASDFDPVLAYQVSGRFEWPLLEEGEGYNRFMFIVERESRRIRAISVVAGAKLSVLTEDWKE